MSAHQGDLPKPKFQDKSEFQIDRLRHAAFQGGSSEPGETRGPIDFNRLITVLKTESDIPQALIYEVVHTIRANIDQLGLKDVDFNLILQWMSGLFKQAGYGPETLPLQSLDLSLSDVELSIFYPTGSGAGSDQNPEATSQHLAQRVKKQFAIRRIFQRDLIAAHESGDLELLHLGAADRPHDVFLTPEYVKLCGLPMAKGGPSAGPARKPAVILSHMVRFTHQLRNHFAGDIQWGYANTLLLPLLEGLSDAELKQFIQQLLFEFAQIDVARGSLERRVILDFDFDMPRPLANIEALGPGGQKTGKPYGHYAPLLTRFNTLAFEVLEAGDFRHNPFHSPHIQYHFNQAQSAWSTQHQKLAQLAFQFGNPTLAFSARTRDLGGMGRWAVNDADFLTLIQKPERLRGFSYSSAALNLPRLAVDGSPEAFVERLHGLLDLACSAHRLKLRFTSRLMAYGDRGPLQFLRQKWDGAPFLKIDRATQPIQLIGLAEAASLLNGSPISAPEAQTQMAAWILEKLKEALDQRNQIHRLQMRISGTKHPSLAYRFAYLDFVSDKRELRPYLLKAPQQSHPIYTEGANILAFQAGTWRNRVSLEGRLHRFFDGFHNLTLYTHGRILEDPALWQSVIRHCEREGIHQLSIAPEFQICLSCDLIFSGAAARRVCPNPDCRSDRIDLYGLCQSHFSPHRTWCPGKQSEWHIRARMDAQNEGVQTQLPI